MARFTLLLVPWLLVACSGPDSTSAIEIHWVTMSHESCTGCEVIEYEHPSGRPETWLVDKATSLRLLKGDVAEARVLRSSSPPGDAELALALIPSESGRRLLAEFTGGGSKGGPIAVLVDGEMVDLGALAPDSRMLLLDDFRGEEELEDLLRKTSLRGLVR